MKYKVKDGNVIYCSEQLPHEIIQTIYNNFDKIYNDEEDEEDI